MSRKQISAVYFFLALSFILSSFCKKGTPTQPEPPVTVKDDPSFASDIQVVFTASCALSGCHNASASAGLNLSQGQAYNNLVNVLSTQEPPKVRVVPNDATNSYLVIKLEGRQTVGGRMPLGGSALNANHIQNIKNWINKGAKDN